MRSSYRRCLALAACVSCATAARAGELLDRVVARVNGQAITLSDARAAAGLGLVEMRSGMEAIAAATQGLIDRQLMLAEVARFSPVEPSPEAISRELAALEGKAGSRANLEALMRSTGLDESRVRELARDSLRIRAYLDQRFGASVQGQTIEQWSSDLRRRAKITILLSRSP